MKGLCIVPFIRIYKRRLLVVVSSNSIDISNYILWPVPVENHSPVEDQFRARFCVFFGLISDVNSGYGTDQMILSKKAKV